MTVERVKMRDSLDGCCEHGHLRAASACMLLLGLALELRHAFDPDQTWRRSLGFETNGSFGPYLTCQGAFHVPGRYPESAMTGSDSAPLLRMTTRVFVTRVGARDALDYGGDLLVHERRPAADPVPAKKQLHHHRRVHPVPEQVPGQRGDRIIAFAGRDAIADQLAPVRDWVAAPRRLLRLSQDPIR